MNGTSPTLNALRRLGRQKRVLASVVAGTALMLGLAAGALAVHDEGFQLDGNIDSQDLSTGVPTHPFLVAPFDGPVDWYDSSVTGGGPNGIFTVASATSPGTPNSLLPTHFLAAGFVKDFNFSGSTTSFTTYDPTTYTTGAKDINDINTWRCVGANNVPNKGDITNAYATVQLVNGQRYVYFAMEKDTVNGDNNVGFWFLQDPGVGCQGGGTGNGNAWTGHHVNGDIFVVSEFTNGGGISTISAYVWKNGALTGPVATGVDCLSTSANDNICATTNRQAITPPWLHAAGSSVGGSSVSIPTASFFEGGINLDDPAFGFTSQCFSQFVADTRSSQSTSATLYDYALGSLPVCGDVTIKKVTVPANSGSDSFSYTTTGGAPLTGFSLDTNPTTTTPTDSQFFQDVPPGAYSVTEGNTTGWALTNLVCTKDGAPFTGGDAANASTGVASWQMGFGDHVICTYTNVQPLAKISISPNGTNQVGTPHTFTVTVSKDLRDGAGWVAASGVTVTGAKVSGVGSITGGTCSSGTTDASGQCTIIVNSTAVGTGTYSASATVDVLGVSIPVATDGTGNNSGPATKTWVDARITIGTSGTNQVGTAHTFTVTVQQDLGDGAGFVAASGVTVTPSISGLVGATITGGTCTTTTTDLSGQCTVIVNSTATGTATVNATAGVVIGSVTVDVDTAGYGAYSISNQKTWVDARISITPNGTNGITEPHTFTVTVEQNDGSGWAAASGVTVTGALEAGSVGSITGGTCSSGTTDASGQCTIIVNSNTPGTATADASTTVTIGSFSIDVATNGYGAYTVENQKTWIAGSLAWVKHDQNGNLLGGATFQVCRTIDRFGNTLGSPVCVTVLDNNSPDADPVAGQFLLTNLVLGTYTITETVAPPGYQLDTYVDTEVLTLTSPNATASHVFIDTVPGQGCTPGFWQGGLGVTLWDQQNDPDWTAHGGTGTNPFVTTDLLTPFFTATGDSSVDGQTMLSIVGSGGGSDWAQKAARDLIAAYLNASFGLQYPYSTATIVSDWNTAVAGGTSGFQAFHAKYSVANQLGCPIS